MVKKLEWKVFELYQSWPEEGNRGLEPWKHGGINADTHSQTVFSCRPPSFKFLTHWKAISMKQFHCHKLQVNVAQGKWGKGNLKGRWNYMGNPTDSKWRKDRGREAKKTLKKEKKGKSRGVEKGNKQWEINRRTMAKVKSVTLSERKQARKRKRRGKKWGGETLKGNRTPLIYWSLSCSLGRASSTPSLSLSPSLVGDQQVSDSKMEGETKRMVWTDGQRLDHSVQAKMSLLSSVGLTHSSLPGPGGCFILTTTPSLFPILLL